MKKDLAGQGNNFHEPYHPTAFRWLASVALNTTSDFLGTIAAFVPMKAVFILAGGSVPSFFPTVLVNAGPEVTTLVLVLTAVAMAFVSLKTKQAAKFLYPLDGHLLASEESDKVGSAGSRSGSISVNDSSLILLSVVLVAVSAIFSLSLTILILLWSGLSALVVFKVISRRGPSPSFSSGYFEFKKLYKSWMISASLWVTALAAILVLLVDPPSMGLTAILLNSVLLLRFQRAASELAGYLTPFSRDSEVLIAKKQKEGSLRAPWDVVSSSHGGLLFRDDLSAAGFMPDSLIPVGKSSRFQTSFLAMSSDSNDWSLIRLFTQDSVDLRDDEASFRMKLSGSLLAPSQVTALELSGLPALSVNWPDSRALAETVPEVDQVAAWQLEIESTVMEHPELADDFSECPTKAEFGNLAVTLEKLAVFQGPQQSNLQAILQHFPEIEATFFEGHRVLGMRSLSPSSFLSMEDGSIEPIAFSSLCRSPVGAFWGNSQVFGRELDKRLRSGSVSLSGELLDAARARSSFMAFWKALDAGDMPKVSALSREVLSTFAKLP